MAPLSRLLLCSLCLALSAVHVARAQVTFTVTGTSTSTGAGYANSTSYTFTFVTVATFPNTSSSVFTSSLTDWNSDPNLNGPIFTSITGSGLTGSLATGTLSQDLRAGVSGGNSYFQVDLFNASAPSSNTLGLSANGNALNEIYLNLSPLSASPFSFTQGATYVDIPGYFSGYTSSYNFTPDTNQIYLNLYIGGSQVQRFNVTNLQIAIPEPAVWPAAVGSIALGLTCWRRRLLVRT